MSLPVLHVVTDDGVISAANFLARATDPDFASIGGVIAVQYFRQGALAGPILAQQGDHFPRPNLEMGDIVGQQAAEPFDDPVRFQERRPAGIGRTGAQLTPFRGVAGWHVFCSVITGAPRMPEGNGVGTRPIWKAPAMVS